MCDDCLEGKRESLSFLHLNDDKTITWNKPHTVIRFGQIYSPY